MRVRAVIGANFGDEGKGRLVDQYAATSKGSVIVVRYNGGAQAGHTVVTPEGVRHSFHHFGSGTLAGASTFLSQFFISNPYLFKEELDELKKVGVTPQVFVDKRTPISTLYDMLINREIEMSRGKKRHGSCGYGIAETVERLCNSKFHTFFSTYTESDKGLKFVSTVNSIRDFYLPKRLKFLGVRKASDWLKNSVASEELISVYYDCLKFMLSKVQIVDPTFLLNWKNIIFEGAQGLCLDESHRFFPYVTRSRIGLSNILEICREIGVKSIDVTYVTRAYLTRHGPGPFPTEDKSLVYEDLTNVYNDWQGDLRFGCLDIDLLKESIENDLNKAGDIKVKPSIAITCFDQVDDDVKIKCLYQTKVIDKKALPTIISHMTGINKVLISRSESRSLKTKERDKHSATTR